MIGFIMVIVFTACILHADEIHLKNGRMLEGEIIRITKKKIEYKPAGFSLFGEEDLEKVSKIIYKNGQQILFLKNIHDSIYLREGGIIDCRINQITATSIAYTLPDAKKSEIRRDSVERVFLGETGNTINFANDSKKSGKPDGTGTVESNLSSGTVSGGFMDSFMRISVAVAFGEMYGELLKKENRAFKLKQPLMVATYGFLEYELTSYVFNWSADLDLMLPAIKFARKKSVDLTGIKFGVKARYGNSDITSSIRHGNFAKKIQHSADVKTMTKGRLLTYKYWGTGPVIDFIISPPGDNFSFLLNLYAAFGTIIDGRLASAVATRKTGLFYLDLLGIGDNHIYPFNYVNYSTKVGGYTMRFGIGPHMSFNKWAPVTIGANAIYSSSVLKLRRGITSYYDWKKTMPVGEFGLELSLGLYI